MTQKVDFLDIIQKVKQDITLPPAVICDLDGTLCHMNDLREFFEWSKVGLDEVDTVIRDLINMEAKNGTKILITSGRDEECGSVTAFWLKEHGIHFDEIFMRTHKDGRKDQEVKYELWEENIRDEYFVKYVLDDRQQVVDLWRKMGFTCLQVAVSPD